MNAVVQKNVLQEIVDRTRRELERRKRRAYRVPECQSEGDRSANAHAALTRGGAPLPRIIAEIKFRSPSAGQIQTRDQGAVHRVARAYEQGGASAVSVLTDRLGFEGNVLDVRRASQAVSVPVLFKGFVIDPLQIDLARYVGASMVLLIVRALDKAQLKDLVQHAQSKGVAPLVEAADAAELDLAMQSGARLVGVNARDLRNFKVDPQAAHQLITKIPSNFISIYMSGINSKADLQRVAQTHADAVLIGETLMRAADPARELQNLLR